MLFGRKNKYKNVIRFADEDRGLVLYRYGSDKEDLPLLPGSVIQVLPGQEIAFMTDEGLADVMDEGNYRLNAETFLILAERIPFEIRPLRPLKAELYFVNKAPVTERKWATKSPALVEQNGHMYAVRAFGTYGFQVTDVIAFLWEIFFKRGLKSTYEITAYLSSMLANAFSAIVGEMSVPVTSLINHPQELSDAVRSKANRLTRDMGFCFIDVMIEGASLPDNKGQKI